MTDTGAKFDLHDAIHHVIFMSEVPNEQVLEVLRVVISDVEGYMAELEELAQEEG